jgi:hypothetical protein
MLRALRILVRDVASNVIAESVIRDVVRSIIERLSSAPWLGEVELNTDLGSECGYMITSYYETVK